MKVLGAVHAADRMPAGQLAERRRY